MNQKHHRRSDRLTQQTCASNVAAKLVLQRNTDNDNDWASNSVETVPAKPASQILPPYVLEVQVNCEDCGGSGIDPGGLDPWGPDVCPTCLGNKTRTMLRNYLAEAFHIAANPDSIRTVEKQHLIAVIQHCRETVRAFISLPDVA